MSRQFQVASGRVVPASIASGDGFWLPTEPIDEKVPDVKTDSVKGEGEERKVESSKEGEQRKKGRTHKRLVLTNSQNSEAVVGRARATGTGPKGSVAARRGGGRRGRGRPGRDAQEVEET